MVGACDVMVTDSLTGNILMKIVFPYCTGGSYEAVGYGYGRGYGEGYDRLVMIVSRASGAPVLANAMWSMLQTLVKNDYREIAKKEYEAAKKAGLEKVIAAHKPATKESSDEKLLSAHRREFVHCVHRRR